MEDKIKRIISNEYDFNIEYLNILEGGYFQDETYIFGTLSQQKYVVKYLRYKSTFEHLELILKFENLLYESYEYPCPQIILTKTNQYLVQDDDRLLFIQTYIQGNEPTKDFLDQDQIYLNQMGCLLAKWRMASRNYSFHIQKDEDEEFTENWWKQQLNTTNDPFLRSNLVECKEYLININDKFERGLIHNDFHSNNSLITNDGQIFVIDFVDAYKSLFIGDLATSLFHLLIDQQNDLKRAKHFLKGYQQIIEITNEEKFILEKFIQLKLTSSIIEDFNHSNHQIDSFIQSSLDLLNRINQQKDFIQNLFE